MRGTHCIRHWSSTQPTVSLSSGEAELTGIAKGLSHGIGLRSIAADLGLDVNLKLRTDATAAIGMAKRLGVGKVRHLDTSLLWVQEKVRAGDVVLEKVPGVENPGDVLTKHVMAPDLKNHLARMHLEAEEGRAATAPKLTSSVRSQLATTMKVIRQERARLEPETHRLHETHNEDLRFSLSRCLCQLLIHSREVKTDMCNL